MQSYYDAEQGAAAAITVITYNRKDSSIGHRINRLGIPILVPKNVCQYLTADRHV